MDEEEPPTTEEAMHEVRRTQSAVQGLTWFLILMGLMVLGLLLMR